MEEIILRGINLVMTIIGVSGIVHILQEKFTTSKVFQNTHPVQYYALRGGFVVLAAAQLSSLLFPPFVPFIVGNMCVGLIAHIVSENLD